MSSVDELCALGFEQYWVNQALELTNHNQDYALEWLLSDEFKLARQQFNEQKKKFKENQKKTKQGLALPAQASTSQPPTAAHSKDPSLQHEVSHHKPKPKPKSEECEIEYNLNEPDLKPKQTLTDFKKIGIDHLLAGDDSDDSDDAKKDPNLPMDDMDRISSAHIDMDEEPDANDEAMQNFLQKLKNQVKAKGDDWLCHSCGVEVAADLNECHMCNAVRPGDTDWICSTCTFVNAEDDGVCQMCLSQKPSDELDPHNAKISLQAEETWSCPACQYHNAKTNCCRMCGYELGTEVTPQAAPPRKEDDDADANVLLELARGDNTKTHLDPNGSKSPMSPSKHVSANSGADEDVFAAIHSGWDLPDAPDNEIKVKKEIEKELKSAKKNGGGGGGGMVMMMRKPKKKQKEEESDEEEEEEEFEESSVEEVVGQEDPAASMAVAPDNFEIPMMDDEQLQENADMVNVSAPAVGMEPNKAPELSGMELLKSMYAKDEKKATKIKLKLRVGTVVDIYSSSRQDWVEGIIKEIKGDLICIVYGKHMKWLKKNSRQLRPKAQQVKAALQNQSSLKQEEIQPNAPLLQEEPQLDNDVPPAAFAEPEFQPPPPSDPPPAFAMNDNQDLLAPMQPDHFNTPKQQKHEPAQPNHMEAAADEFDYDVTFTTSVLGLELYPDKEGKNCIVGKCLSKTSKKFVDPSSIIVAVNDVWVAGMSYDMVRDAIKQAAKYPPLKIQFRVKMKDIGKKKDNAGMNERGYLKVKVVAGVQLKHRASYCVVQVGNARLSTREVPRDEHPEWQEMLTFKNFRPDVGKKATVTVYDHSTILKDKKIGTTEYEIPTRFNKLQRDTLELKSSKNKLSGVLILNTIIVHKSNSIRHLRKY
eukprot:61413_1